MNSKYEIVNKSNGKLSLEAYTLETTSDFSLYRRYLRMISDDIALYLPEIFFLEYSFEGTSFHYFLLFQDNIPIVIMPFIKRPIPFKISNESYFDITSPYGYGGPLINEATDPQILVKFWDNVDKWYKKNNIVSEFIRFNLRGNSKHYNGKLVHTLTNVVGKIIDEKEQWKNLKHKVRTNYRKSLEYGLVSKIIKENITTSIIDEFYMIYSQTMKRKGAIKEYNVPKSFFLKYISNNPDHCAISLVYYENKPVSAEFLLLSRDRIYSFLGGTLSNYFFVRPNDFLKIETINWGRKLGYQYYVLGGGREDDDSLYNYKKSFFPKETDFSFLTGRKIINKKIYTRLTKENKGTSNIKESLIEDMSGYFPKYRKSNPSDVKKQFDVINTKEKWDQIINKFEDHEFYHTYDYHELSKKEGENPVLIVYFKEDSLIAFPLIIRSIPNTKYRDATSVYGYPGPLAIFGKNFNIEVFSNGLAEFFKELGLVSVFSRLNPYCATNEILGNLGEIIQLGKVVYIDLTKSVEEQRTEYSKSTKSRVNKARRLCHVKKVSSMEDLEIFIDIYYENMERLNATEDYFFSREYFRKFYTSKEISTEILMVYDNETNIPIAASMFVISNNVVQFHLSGTRTDFLHLAPARLFIDEMRINSTGKGFRYFNLGGGVGGQEDSLFEFKASFSNDFKMFSIWKYIVNNEVYENLTSQNNLINIENKHEISYFPLYRYHN